jgi:hypothetical protein
MGQPPGRVHFSKDFAAAPRRTHLPETPLVVAGLLTRQFIRAKKIRRKRGGLETNPN